MAKASLSDIYDRMHSVANYHPFTADTFADWSLEAGDIVTIGRDGDEIASPIHAATVRWNGRQRVSLESRGEKERESVAKMSARAFNGGGNGGGAYRSGGRRTNKEKTRYTELVRTDDEIKAAAIDTERKLTAAIKVQADRIDIVIDKDGHIKAGIVVEIVDEINEGKVTISADKIALDGNTTIANVMSISGTAVFISRPLYVGGSSPTGSVLLTGGRVVANEFDLRSGPGSGNALNVINAEVSGNTLTITRASGGPITFSKATTLEGAWNSSTRRYTATAYQNNGTKTQVAQISTVIASSIAGADIEWDDTYWGRATIKAQNESGAYVTAATNVLINGKGAYDNGKASVTHNIDIPSSQIYTTTGSPPSGSESLGTMKTRVLQAIEDGDTLVFRVDCGGTSKHYHMSF